MADLVHSVFFLLTDIFRVLPNFYVFLISKPIIFPMGAPFFTFQPSWVVNLFWKVGFHNENLISK